MEQIIAQKIETWLNGPYDAETKTAIRQMREEELIDAFYKDLEFGTGGLRGLMGVGTNRINRYTLGAATQGLANYLQRCYGDQIKKVVIAYDSRNNSKAFAQVVADVFSANYIQVYLFESLRPTPLLSFAIRQLGCQSGVVLTASHNPKEYNGYKAYWNDGGQVVPPHDQNIIAEVKKIKHLDQILFEPKPELIQLVGAELDKAYLQNLLGLSVNLQTTRKQKSMPIVYSALHGTGITLVPQALAQLGFENIHLVEAQSVSDGNFPTVIYPNPEEQEAMRMALELGQKVGAEIVMATDPDADRVGIAVRNDQNELVLLNGNQTAALLVAYLIEAWQKAQKLDGRQMVIKTIVTTDLIRSIAEANGVKCYETLTGFKYIAELIRALEGQEEFIVGGEESYGYMIGDSVRDKDAVASCALIAEMCAHARENGVSLYQRLKEIYVKYGFYYESLISLTKKGKKGLEEIDNMMSQWRENPPKTFGGSPVVEVLDYKHLVSKNLQTQQMQRLDFPKSNVLQFVTANGSRISVRPSGTEPKIKFYISVKQHLADVSDFNEAQISAEAQIKQISEELS